jgi:hypothetical protein
LQLPIQTIFPGVLENALRRELQNLISRRVVPRLWSKDTSLWPLEQHEVESASGNLNWLDLPEQLGPLMARVVVRAAQIEQAGFEDVVFVAIGESSLAAEATLRLPDARLGRSTFLLDTIDPDSIRSLEEQINLHRTLFIFASKSGKRIENHVLLLYFLERLRALGIDSPGSHFVALSEGDSYLTHLARSYAFTDTFLDPAGILGRYSGLIHFNFFLATLGHFDSNDLLARTQAMRDLCRSSAPNTNNPALHLAALLAAAGMEGFDRLILLTPESLEAFCCRVGSLIGSSTGKSGRGIAPILGHLPNDLEQLRRKCLVALVRMPDNDSEAFVRKREEIRAAGIPIVDVELNGPEELAAELFKWEIATALACVPLQANPFQDSFSRESNTNTVQILDQMSTDQQLPVPTVRVREEGLELSAEGETRQQISTLNMTEALRTFLRLRDPEGYLALIPFAGRNDALKAASQRIRDSLETGLGIPVSVMPASHYLNCGGQAYKSGPTKGLFILITANPARDFPVPGAHYSFGQLQLAQALAEFDSLGRNERPVIRLHLARGAEQGFLQLESTLISALGKRPFGAS